MQYRMNKITTLVNLVRKYESVMSNEELNQMKRQDTTIFGTPLTGEAYQAYHAVFWMIIYNLYIRGPEWSYVSRFERAQDRNGICKVMKWNFKGKPQMI